MKNKRSRIDTIKKIARIVGLTLAVPFFVWLPLGLIPAVPSIIDVFGSGGLRYPTGVLIGGLMLAAFGYEDF